MRGSQKEQVFEKIRHEGIKSLQTENEYHILTAKP